MRPTERRLNVVCGGLDEVHQMWFVTSRDRKATSNEGRSERSKYSTAFLLSKMVPNWSTSLESCTMGGTLSSPNGQRAKLRSASRWE